MARYRVGNMYLSQEEYDDHNRRMGKIVLFVVVLFVLAAAAWIARESSSRPPVSSSRTKRPAVVEGSKPAENPRVKQRRARTAMATPTPKDSEGLRASTPAPSATKLVPLSSYTTPEGRVVIVAPPPR